jgi:glutathione peroxidase
MGLYDLTVKKQDGSDFNLSEFKGKVLLIVNTATGCGLTPQYEGLENLYQKYKERGLEILDFPCNQFLGQAPGTDEEINTFCTLKYNTTFPRFKKINVNGKEADPFFEYLKSQKKGRIKWNFTKFLVDREGNVVARFEPMEKPEKFEEQIVKLLG